MALTDKQETFCREYLIDLNATQALIRTGIVQRLKTTPDQKPVKI
ncbi:terminase small subunit [Pantoea ananatis]